MRRSITVVVVGLVVGIWIGSCTGLSHVGAYQGGLYDIDLSLLKNEVAFLEMDINRLSGRLDMEIMSLQTQMMVLQMELDDANDTIKDMDSRLGDAQYKIDRLTRDVRTLQRSK